MLLFLETIKRIAGYWQPLLFQGYLTQYHWPTNAHNSTKYLFIFAAFGIYWNPFVAEFRSNHLEGLAVRGLFVEMVTIIN